MTQQYIMAIDQGTTGSTVLILDVTAKNKPLIVGRSSVEFTQYYPQLGWVEHDLGEIWQSVMKAAKGAFDMASSQKGFQPSEIIGIGITNQRETLCCWDRGTGNPLMRAMVWQDKRGMRICDDLKEQEAFIRERTGLVVDPYFSASKMKWIMDNDSSAAAKLKNGSAVFGTIDTYLLYKLTSGKVFATESSNASRTLIFDSGDNKYNLDLMELFGVPGLDCLPEVVDSAGKFGETLGVPGLPDGIPISGILGDQQAALAGQTCFKVGEAKCTYGTGAFMLLNTGSDFRLSDSGLLSTVAWSLGGKLTYAIEGSSFIAGAAVQFLRDQLKIVATAQETELLARDVEASPHLYFVPALSGLGAPYWDPEVRGAILGLERGTSKAQIVRATLEGIAFSVADLYNAMQSDYESKDRAIRVDGGAAANNVLMQFQADILGGGVDRPKNLETTAMGAALFAGLGIGLYDGVEELSMLHERDKLFSSHETDDDLELRFRRLEGWKRAVKASRVFSGLG